MRRHLAAVVAAIACVVSTTASAQTFTRVDSITYKDDLNSWILGQIAVRSSAGVAGAAVETDKIEYNAQSLPEKIYKFGKLQQTLTYYADGTLATVTDGNGNATSLSGWKRGVPQKVTFADQTYKAAQVSDDGTIAWTRDETGAVTCYGYDAMLRVNLVVYPSESESAPGACAKAADGDKWAHTTIGYDWTTPDEYGIPAGHWRRIEQTGNYRKLTYYDALLRPIVDEDVDLADTGNTNRWTTRRYDADGRAVFVSYPRNLFQSGWVTWNSVANGTRTSYDVLGRVTRVEQDSELGVLTTTTAYGSDAAGPYTIVTNPRQQVTRTWYQAFDEPTFDSPVRIDAPEAQRTTIAKDVLGRTLSITRGSSN